jgi:hypothetical protein
VWSNLQDMANWDAAIQTNKLLKPATMKLALLMAVVVERAAKMPFGRFMRQNRQAAQLRPRRRLGRLRDHPPQFGDARLLGCLAQQSRQ